MNRTKPLALRMSLPFAIILQFLQGLNGYSWWMLFSSVGVWSLLLPVSTTYGGAAMVMVDDARGFCYTSDWARVLTAAFLSIFFTLILLSVGAVAVLILGLFGIVL